MLIELDYVYIKNNSLLFHGKKWSPVTSKGSVSGSGD